MTTFEMTKEGLFHARLRAEQGLVTKGNLPIRIDRETLKDALVYYWGRGIDLDPSHLKWELKATTS